MTNDDTFDGGWEEYKRSMEAKGFDPVASAQAEAFDANSNSLEAEIEAFAKRRPHYARKHIWDIATNCQGEGIPFCRVCDDWHRPSDEHTKDAENEY